MFHILLIITAVFLQDGSSVQKTLVSETEWSTKEACEEVLNSAYNKGTVSNIIAGINPFRYRVREVTNVCVQTDDLAGSPSNDTVAEVKPYN